MSRGLGRLLVAFCVAQILFATWPGIDLRVSALFHDASTGTWIGAAPGLNLLREGLWLIVLAATGAFAALALVGWRLGSRAAVPSRLWGFALLSMAVIPGLLANGLFKSHWGRARPRSVEAFGGSAEFTPAFQIAGECAANCSFVAGEVAGAATLALVIAALVGPGLAPSARGRLAAGLAAFVATVGLLRLAAGGHFLSDVVFAVFLAAFGTRALWAALGCGRVEGCLTASALGADLRASAAAAKTLLLRPFRRRN